MLGHMFSRSNWIQKNTRWLLRNLRTKAQQPWEVNRPRPRPNRIIHPAKSQNIVDVIIVFHGISKTKVRNFFLISFFFFQISCVSIRFCLCNYPLNWSISCSRFYEQYNSVYPSMGNSNGRRLTVILYEQPPSQDGNSNYDEKWDRFKCAAITQKR